MDWNSVIFDVFNSKKAINYDYGFRLINAEKEVDFPYILMKTDFRLQPNEEQIQRYLHSITKIMKHEIIKKILV